MPIGRAVKRFAVPLQPLAAVVELLGDPAKLSGRIIAELHQILRHHRQLGATLADPLRQDFEQSLERLSFATHSDDGASEALCLLTAGATEDQPEKCEKRERPRRDRQPLGDDRRGKRLPGEGASGRPGRITKPHRRQSDQRDRKNLPPTCSEIGGQFLGRLEPLLFFHRTVGKDVRARQFEGLEGIGQRMLSTLGDRCHRNTDITTFEASRKRLEKGFEAGRERISE